MPRASDREIEESYDRVYGIPDDEDEALIEHVMWPDGKPKQGLHAKPQWEDDAVDEYFYKEDLEWELEW